MCCESCSLSSRRCRRRGPNQRRPARARRLLRHVGVQTGIPGGGVVPRDDSGMLGFHTTTDPATCSNCLSRLRAAGRPFDGVVVPAASLTLLRFESWKELEDRVIVPFRVPWVPRARHPRPGWDHDVLREVGDLKGLVSDLPCRGGPFRAENGGPVAC
jgi:hypothetical protein